MTSDHGRGSPHGSDYMDEQAFAQYLEGDLANMTDAESENNDHDMELVQSPAEPLTDKNVPPAIEVTNTIPQETHRSERLPFVVPDGVEVIDLDMLDDNSFVFVSEVPDITVRVKAEPVETVMSDIEQHFSIPRHGDERLDTFQLAEPGRGVPAASLSNATVNLTDDVHNSGVKEEYDSDSPLEFVWSMDMTKEQIIISDNEGDKPVVRPTVAQGKGRTDVVERVTKHPIPPVKKFLLTKKPKDPRAQLTDADKARMMAIQAKLAAMATGRPVTGGTGSATAPPAGPSLPALPAGPSFPTQPADPHAWMVEEVEDDDDGAAEKFEALRGKYKAKQRCGKARFEDAVNFEKAEKAERARLKKLEYDILYTKQTEPEIPAPGGAEDEEEELFFPVADLPQTQQKRHRNAVVNDISGDDGEPSNKRSKHGPSEKQMHARVRNEGMLAAVEAEMIKNKAGNKKSKGKPKGSGDKMVGDKKVSDKKRPSRRKTKSGSKATGHSADKPKSAKPPKKPRVKGVKAKGKATQPTLLNVNSLLHSNVYVDANAGHNSAPIPSMTEKRKVDALKQLLASVPLEDQRMANREKEYIRKATVQLGKHRVKADGKGGWAFKGLISSLTHHQVQGAAWMREREIGLDEPLGGIVADEMGFGKTIQMLACMVANPPPRESQSKATLIVATHALCLQWAEEIAKHVDRKVLGTVINYHRSSRLEGDGAVELLQSAGVILTTYSEVLRSYPKYNPPKELMTHQKRMEWWKDYYDEERGVLHHIPFFRVVLDEAHAIKNHLSQTSIACRGLVATRRWAMTGTPIQNSVEELYPYFKFLHVKHTGTFEVFKENFCDKSSGISNERLHSFLRQFLIRRTHSDRLFGAPLITLPKNNEKTVYLDFNEVERAIYEIVRHRYIKRINEWKKSGVLQKSYSNVLTMLLRLRQLTAHVFLLQETIEDLVELEDVERLWRGTAGEVETASGGKDATGKNMLIQMRKMIADKGNAKDNQRGSKSAPTEADEDDAALEESQPLVFKFRKFLRGLAEGSKWDAIAKRSLCHKCRDVPTDPQVTDCLHIYCKECLRNMTYEAAQDGEDYAACLECGTVYSQTRPCSGLKELGYDETVVRSESGTPVSARRPKRDPEDDIKWVSMEGGVLPSTKSTAMVAQVEEWWKEDPKCKIIIFTQWHLMIKIIGRICDSRGWGHCVYHGKMTHEARAKTIGDFRNKKDIKIMVASLKCGGVGLNLTCASRVINIDLFWNSSVEMQAFCRVFRIGQDKETFITRFVVKNTVDEKLQALQQEKKETIDAAIGDDGKRLAKLSLQELLRLFGPVQDEGGKEFILVDDEDEYADTMPTIANEHEDNVYVPPPNM